MNDEMLRTLIASVFFLVIYIIIDLKVKNFKPEKYNVILILIMIIALTLVKKTSSINDTLVILLIPIIYIIFQKNKIYFLKGIDKKFIKENKSEIAKIIESYKNDNLDDKSYITFLSYKIVFENVSEPQVYECLSLIGSYIDDNRKKYTSMDYFIYYIKSLFIPFIIAISAALILVHLTRGLIIR